MSRSEAATDAETLSRVEATTIRVMIDRPKPASDPRPGSGVTVDDCALVSRDLSTALDVHEGLRDCLGNLAEPRRMAVACHLQGYSVPEAAGFLGWTRKKTEHLVRRGLMDLRTCLAGKGLTP